MTHIYKVTGMTCNSCVSKVQKTLSEINGVENVKVTLNPPGQKSIWIIILIYLK